MGQTSACTLAPSDLKPFVTVRKMMQGRKARSLTLLHAIDKPAPAGANAGRTVRHLSKNHSKTMGA
jgi:hypothetical protein